MTEISSVIFFMFCIALLTAFNLEENEKKFATCGLYGFRCLDKKRAQICGEMYDNGGNTSTPIIFECGKGLMCDEEKKEFCAPLETSYINCTCREPQLHKEQKRQVRKRSYMIDTLSEPNDDGENDPPEESKIDPWNGSPPISCTSQGFYPDTNNNSLFFFCDLNHENKFILRHMQCGPRRTYEPNFKACVLEGSTRRIRDEGNSGEKPKILSSNTTSTFKCLIKKPGKYPDKQDCHLYHLCLQSDLFSPFEHLVVECPHSTAYDRQKKKCTKMADRLCNKTKSSNVYCEEEIRFRETRSCSHYFLCYQNQVVQFFCPSGYEFDENLQFCEPERFVKC